MIFLKLIVLSVAVVFLFKAVVTALVKRSEPYRRSLAMAQSFPGVIEAMGRPVVPSLFLSGKVDRHLSGPCGRINFSIVLKGPKRSGLLQVMAIQNEGQWQYRQISVRPHNSKETIQVTTY